MITRLDILEAAIKIERLTGQKPDTVTIHPDDLFDLWHEMDDTRIFHPENAIHVGGYEFFFRGDREAPRGEVYISTGRLL